MEKLKSLLVRFHQEVVSRGGEFDYRNGCIGNFVFTGRSYYSTLTNRRG